MSRRKKEYDRDSVKYSNDKMVNRYTAKTPGQADFLRSIIENQITIVMGVSGTGKTALSLCLMAEHLITNKTDRLIITRPFIECSPVGIGFLKGSLVDKTAPYLIPIEEYLTFFLGQIQYRNLVESGKIEIVPLEFMRGRTFGSHDRCIMLLDEAQQATMSQIKMVLTRTGVNCRMIINGDVKQTDLLGKFQSGLLEVFTKLQGVPGIGTVELGIADICRSGLIGQILGRLEA